MARLRDLITRYPVAAAAIAVAVVALVGWRTYRALSGTAQSGPPAASTKVGTHPPATPSPAPSATIPPDGTAGSGAVAPGSPAGGRGTAGTTGPATAGSPSGNAAGAPQTPGPTANAGPSQDRVPSPAQPGSPTAPAGRSDPFISPLGAAVGGTGGPGVASLPLPPVPPLPPGAIGPGGGPYPPGRPAAPPQPVYRLTGILGDTSGLAIVEDGSATHIVAAGDVLAPGVRVVSVDPVRGVVALTRDGVPITLRMDQGGNAR
jgi:hypothetical protein